MTTSISVNLPVEDLGFKYHRAFDDLDGHIWEAMWLNPAMAG